MATTPYTQDWDQVHGELCLVEVDDLESCMEQLYMY